MSGPTAYVTTFASTRRVDELGRPLVVGVDHRALGPALVRVGRADRQPLEQRALGRYVLLHRAVQVEVLVGDVGQHRDVVRDLGYALEGQAM
ncbi:MAG: hypothetical protein WD830_00800 [Chloroflexota bacterium]